MLMIKGLGLRIRACKSFVSRTCERSMEVRIIKGLREGVRGSADCKGLGENAEDGYSEI